MFDSKEVPKYQRLIQSELERSVEALRVEMPNSEEYKKALSIVERLHGLLDDRKPSTISKDTMLTVAANLIGIILIINHEYAHPITSKALSFVIRPR